MSVRRLLDRFALANPTYVGATLTAYTVDVNGAKTTTKATLYDSHTGTGTVTNPQTLDSDGKLAQATYIAEPVIISIAGLSVADHDTGIMFVPGKWRGEWVTATLYYPGEWVRDVDAGNVYTIERVHISGTFATDVSSAELSLAINSLTWTGAWSGATAYVVNDLAYTSGITYVCILAHTNQAQPNATYWEVFATGGMGNIVEDITPQLGGALDTNNKAINESEGTSVVAAASTDIWAVDGNNLHITGNTGITDFGTALRAGAVRWITIDGTPTLTHSVNLNLPGSANYTAEAGDIMRVYADTTTQFDVLIFPAAGQLQPNKSRTLTVGFSATPYDAGTKSSGTFTPDEANGNFQYVVNGGAHTLAPPTNSSTLVLQYTNNASAGTITTSGFTKVTGTTPTTTNGDDFLAYVTKINGFSHLSWQALQ